MDICIIKLLEMYFYFIQIILSVKEAVKFLNENSPNKLKSMLTGLIQYRAFYHMGYISIAVAGINLLNTLYCIL